MVGRYVAPEYGVTPFTCPHCDTLAPQEFGEPSFWNNRVEKFDRAGDDTYLTMCSSCRRSAVWIARPDYRRVRALITGRVVAAEEADQPSPFTMVYPAKSAAPPPNEDLPDDIAEDYKEAAGVLALSPRSSAALLRLCLQKLCVHYGQPGKDINTEVGELVKAETIRPMVQQAMDAIRISGNESVDPGELNVNDDPELALALFRLINLIADEAITQPKKVKEIYDKMPENKRKGVTQRDGTPPSRSSSPAL